ncbi:OB-fold domain-containing protein [Mycobacterium sp. CVI_P3]|uniref:OB-fold domain-containing protein n=1 Tax=Mycobacterium pinniadriaticum TaxID=2994102 RepID=A0ABT3SCN7_9MYCO|nr:OB-fold domain-containing protein [Mycobacterium pinniadriaticum]MCX2930853.1 OB-fold domain-containing protein [Mycobacterium pinniadriaticum]MCX2937277.1 OB-fold domain-containing protein [Mycobacterium pinniadriaticum]
MTPTASLVSWTVAEHQVHPAFPVPYTLVLVELDDAPQVRWAGYLQGRPDLRAGMRMRAAFVSPADGVTLVNWVPDPDEGESDERNADHGAPFEVSDNALS